MNKIELWIKRKIKGFAIKTFHSSKYGFIISYFNHRKRLPNLKAPHDLSEILIKRVIDGEVDKLYYLADKYLMRDYVKDKGLKDFLPKLLGVYDQAEDIDFESLPNKFALKMNFGAGMNIICSDKSKLDIQQVKEQLTKWLNGNSIYSNEETHYNLIKRRIICEEFIDDGNEGLPVDYKFMCVKGEPLCCLVCIDRNKEKQRYIPLTTSWKYLFDWEIQKEKSIEAPDIPACPLNFDEMINVSKILSSDIPFVRVDLYSNGEQIWIGELTLTPDGCILHRWSDKALNIMGEYYRTH